MRALSDHWVQSLREGVTTICQCWKVIRKDGIVLGFTDHDQDLLIDQILYAAQSGLDSSQSESILGLSTTGRELSGILNSANLTERDLSNGLYDQASLEIWLVDWKAPSNRLLLDIGVFGEVSRSQMQFSVEVRSATSSFDQVKGRLYQAACSADLGDQQCKIDLADPQWTIKAKLAMVFDQSRIGVELSHYPPGHFSNGRISFESGANKNLQALIKTDQLEHALHILSLWTIAPQPFSIGDQIVLNVGCDKTAASCRMKFRNISNFRGFPHMPGNDVLAFYPGRSDSVMDGRSLFK
jgi:uncharacterized phage protein (TIGR02218 family)